LPTEFATCRQCGHESRVPVEAIATESALYKEIDSPKRPTGPSQFGALETVGPLVSEYRSLKRSDRLVIAIFLLVFSGALASLVGSLGPIAGIPLAVCSIIGTTTLAKALFASSYSIRIHTGGLVVEGNGERWILRWQDVISAEYKEEPFGDVYLGRLTILGPDGCLELTRNSAELSEFQWDKLLEELGTSIEVKSIRRSRWA
jgi:hypothetical protein